MDGLDGDRADAGFRVRTRLEDARDAFRELVEGDLPTERVEPVDADGRILAEAVVADRDVPGTDRAAIDGYAVRAADTFGASDRLPAALELEDGGPLATEAATRVEAGDELPEGADAVAPVRSASEREAADELELGSRVAVGDGVTSAGADVRAGQRLYEAGRRVRPSDVGLLRAIGLEAVPVVARPTVAVVPTGDELVDGAGAGDAVETNGLTVSRLVERWGGDAIRREPVGDDPEAIGAALEDARSADAIVTTGGTGIGRRDRVPEAIEARGEVVVHGVAASPARSTALGAVGGTATIALPGAPVSCLVGGVQFLRPAIARLQNREPAPHPTVDARLERKVASEPGIRTFARVRIDGRDDGVPAVVSTRTGGAALRSSAALADGWVVVEEGREGIPAGETVPVESWE